MVQSRYGGLTRCDGVDPVRGGAVERSGGGGGAAVDGVRRRCSGGWGDAAELGDAVAAENDGKIDRAAAERRARAAANENKIK